MSSAERRLVVVLSGGVSSEREVSLTSGNAVLAALDRGRWEVWPCLLEDGARVRFAARGTEVGSFAELREERPGEVREGGWHDAVRAWSEAGVAVVFLALHGEGGEDGVLQGALRQSGFVHTGSDVAGSAACMDKIWSRCVAREFGLALAPGRAVLVDEWNAGRREIVERLRDDLGFPAFVKPARGGSSVGLRRVGDEAELSAALEIAFELGGRVLVEREVAGVEVSCGVLGNARSGSLEVLPPVEIRPARDGWFSYQEKYSAEGAREICPPASLDAKAIARVQGSAILLHRAFGLDGMSRSDFLVRPSGEPVFLETNTIPGLTPRSLLPLEAAAVGCSYPQLLDRILDFALARG